MHCGCTCLSVNSSSQLDQISLRQTVSLERRGLLQLPVMLPGISQSYHLTII